MVIGAGPGRTPGLVCAHHHLYSSLARGMPAPPKQPSNFVEILEQIWWRLDQALDLELLAWSARLGALEALQAGCTAVIDHNESPNVIEGSLTVIADACAEVGIRVSCSYGVTDRHGPDGARRGLEENDRFLRAGGLGYVGVHAAFTCSNETLAAAADLANRHGVGVHVHVAEGMADADAGSRLRALSAPNWLLIHGVHLEEDHGLQGTIVHNPRSNMNNGVGYAAPVRFANPIALGTDGIGADMLEEFRLAFVKSREADVLTSPDVAWQWLAQGWQLFPEAANDRVTWSYGDMDPWHLAYTPAVRAIDVVIDGELVLSAGTPTRVDADEIRAKAAEASATLFQRLGGS